MPLCGLDPTREGRGMSDSPRYSSASVYTLAYYEQLIVCKRFSSHFVNQQVRGGLPESRPKWLTNEDFNSSAAAQPAFCLRLI
jgi:hypothetical protein